MVVSALITAFSQVLLKISANKNHKGAIFEYFNPYIIISYALFAGVMLLNIYIYTVMDYRFGVVINSLSIVFVMLLSRIILRESLTAKIVVGNLIIIAGVVVFTLF